MIDVISKNFVSAMLLSRLNEQEGPQGRLEMVKDFTDFIIEIAAAIPQKEPLASIGEDAVDALCFALMSAVENEPLIPGDFNPRLNQALQAQARQTSGGSSFSRMRSAPIPQEFGGSALFQAGLSPVLLGSSSLKF